MKTELNPMHVKVHTIHVQYITNMIAFIGDTFAHCTVCSKDFTSFINSSKLKIQISGYVN